jgi:hypothetical protein
MTASRDRSWSECFICRKLPCTTHLYTGIGMFEHAIRYQPWPVKMFSGSQLPTRFSHYRMYLIAAARDTVGTCSGSLCAYKLSPQRSVKFARTPHQTLLDSNINVNVLRGLNGFFTQTNTMHDLEVRYPTINSKVSSKLIPLATRFDLFQVQGDLRRGYRLQSTSDMAIGLISVDLEAPSIL